MTGDPSELAKLQKAAALYPAGTSEYTVGTTVYNLSDQHSSPYHEQGEIVGVLMIGGKISYYLQFSSDRYELVPEEDVSYYLPVAWQCRDIYDHVDVESDGSTEEDNGRTPLQALRSGPTISRGSSGVIKSPSMKRSSLKLARALSRKGFGSKGVDEAQPKGFDRNGKVASGKLLPSAMYVDEDLRYLLLPAAQPWGTEAATELLPSYCGVDPDVYDFGVAGSIHRRISSRTTSTDSAQ